MLLFIESLYYVVKYSINSCINHVTIYRISLYYVVKYSINSCINHVTIYRISLLCGQVFYK